MRIVIGLGNPGRDYERTRHNIGFAVMDEFARRMDGVSQRNRFRSTVREGVRGATKFVTAMPQMYMNLSGIPVREIMNWYKSPLADLLVVYDDMDLPLGQLRLRADGSAGGHNGMKSIVNELDTDQFARLRIGIGRGGGSSTGHVLSRFTPDEQIIMERAIADCVDAIVLWSDRGIIEAMNIINKPAADREPTPGVA